MIRIALLLLYLEADAASWLVQAQRYFESRQLERSEAAARKVLELDSRAADAEVLLGLIATVRSQPAEAERHLVRAVELQPRNYRALGYLALAYVQEKRIPEAERTFRRVLELDRGNVAAHYNLGVIAMTQERPGEALAHFRAVCGKDPGDVPALTGKLESELVLKRAAEARATAAVLAMRLDARDPRFLQIAALLASRGEYDTAIGMLEKVRTASPESFDAAYNLGLAYRNAGRYAKAEAVLVPLASTHASAEVWNLLGSVQDRAGRGSDAIASFGKAAGLEPGNEEYRFDYGTALLQHESTEAAVESFTAGTRDLPKSWRMRAGLGAALYIAGRYEGAARNLLEAAALEPGSPVVYFLLGRCHESAGSLQPAIEKALAAYVATGPHDAWAFYNYGMALYRRAGGERSKELEAARTSLKRALALEPGFAEAQMQLGIIAQERGEIGEAVSYLEQSVRSRPKLAAAHYRLALAYRKSGAEERARREMDEFRKLKSAGAGEEHEIMFRMLARRPE